MRGGGEEGGGERGWGFGPQLGTDAWTKGSTKDPKQCVTTLNTECFFPLGSEKLTLFYKSCIFHTLNDDSAAHCPALKKYPFASLFCSSIRTKLGNKRPRASVRGFFFISVRPSKHIESRAMYGLGILMYVTNGYVMQIRLRLRHPIFIRVCVCIHTRSCISV